MVAGGGVGARDVRVARARAPAPMARSAPGMHVACMAHASRGGAGKLRLAGRREALLGGSALVAGWGALGGPFGVGAGPSRAEGDTMEGMLAELEEIRAKIESADKGKESVVRLMDEVIDVQGRIKGAGLDGGDAKKVMLRSAEVKAAIRRLKF